MIFTDDSKWRVAEESEDGVDAVQKIKLPGHNYSFFLPNFSYFWYKCQYEQVTLISLNCGSMALAGFSTLKIWEKLTK